MVRRSVKKVRTGVSLDVMMGADRSYSPTGMIGADRGYSPTVMTGTGTDRTLFSATLPSRIRSVP